MRTISINNKNSKANHMVLLFLLLIILVVGKDLMHSTIRNYSFYWYESLLFGTFWLLFIPLVFVKKSTMKTKQVFIVAAIMSLIHMSLFSFLVYGVSNLFFDDTFKFLGVFTNTISENGIACLLIYGIVNFISPQKIKPPTVVAQLKVPDKISVTHRNQTILLNQEDIIYIKSEKPYIALISNERKYMHNSTLKDFLEKKSTEHFIQIHKSIIINTKHIVSFTSRKNGDYDIQLTNQHTVRASRNFRKNFKPYLVTMKK